MAESRSKNKQGRPTPGKASRWPTGTSYEDVFDYERRLREEAEDKLDRRICALEERMFIAERTNLPETYPELVEAYNEFKNEESKMLVFEALKKTDGDSTE